MGTSLLRPVSIKSPASTGRTGTTRWVVRQAKLDDLQNRLGFLVTLARQLAEQRGSVEAAARLARAEQALEYSRLQREDAFRPSMTQAERKWLRQHRSPEATQWNLLTSLDASELARGF